MINATEWTAQDLLNYGAAMAHRKGFRADDVEDAAQEFAVGAWLAQQKLDPEKGSGRGYVTRGGLNQIKSFVRYSIKGERFGRKAIQDMDGDTYAQEEVKILSGDYNSEDGAGSLSVWDQVADPDAVNPLDALSQQDAVEKAQKAILTLTEAQREVLIARSEGETLQAIADRMGVTREAVRRTEVRAREKALLAA